MRVLQVIGWLMAVATAMIGLYEAVQYFRAGSRSLVTFGQFWFQVSPSTFNGVSGFMNDVIGGTWGGILNLPALFVAGLLAVICLSLSTLMRGGSLVR